MRRSPTCAASKTIIDEVGPVVGDDEPCAAIGYGSAQCPRPRNSSSRVRLGNEDIARKDGNEDADEKYNRKC